MEYQGGAQSRPISPVRSASALSRTGSKFTSPGRANSASALVGGIQQKVPTTIQGLMANLRSISTGFVKRMGRAFGGDKTGACLKKLGKLVNDPAFAGSKPFSLPGSRTRFLYACLPLFVDDTGTTSGNKRDALIRFITTNLYHSESGISTNDIDSEIQAVLTMLTGRDKAEKYGNALQGLKIRIHDAMTEAGSVVPSRTNSPVKGGWFEGPLAGSPGEVVHYRVAEIMTWKEAPSSR